MRFDRSESQPKPVRRIIGDPNGITMDDPRPVRIERTSHGVEFYSNVSGRRMTKEQAVAAMRAYKHGTAAVNAKLGSLTTPPQRKASPRKPKHAGFTVTLWRTSFKGGASKCIAQAHGETFLAMSTKLASLCMKHRSDAHSAVEVEITEGR